MNTTYEPFTHCIACGKSYDSRFVSRWVDEGILTRSIYGIQCAEHGEYQPRRGTFEKKIGSEPGIPDGEEEKKCLT